MNQEQMSIQDVEREAKRLAEMSGAMVIVAMPKRLPSPGATIAGPASGMSVTNTILAAAMAAEGIGQILTNSREAALAHGLSGEAFDESVRGLFQATGAGVDILNQTTRSWLKPDPKGEADAGEAGRGGGA